MESNSINLWQQLVKGFGAYTQALDSFFSAGVDRVALIRKVIGTGDRNVVVTVARYLKEDEHKQLFDIWVGGASTANSVVHMFRKFILALPRDWVMERIESAAEPYLASGDMDEYRRFLELYLLLDVNLTRKLAQRAVEHQNPEIREAGSDFLELLLEDERQIRETRMMLLGEEDASDRFASAILVR
jgi:hypothetical protein